VTDPLRELARTVAGAPEADRALAAAGLTGLEVPAAYGGGGGSYAQLAVVLAALGERAARSTLLSSAVLAAGAVLLAGTDAQRERWLPGLAAGTVRGTAVLGGWFGRPAVTAVPVPAVPAAVPAAAARGGGWTVSGTAGHVPDARGSGLLVVAARAGGGWLVALVESPAPGLAITPRPGTDETRCLDDVTLDAVPVEVLAAGATAERLLGALANRAAAAIAADSLGTARRVLAMTVEHVSRRRQFDRPIGSFQAVQHQAADMHVNVQTSAALVDAAADAVTADPAGADLIVSQAKDHATELAARDAGTALQLHGGIGYTWEYGLHRHLKRALLNQYLYGAPRWHRDRVLRALQTGM
jgi:alkylation response protein AidB-like acyl-CoA dehydrogenase